ncbi:hypothetical protein V5G24_04365 [Xanthobacter sp. VTT E-85241]|uniref:hypothetical protein n=1 Tax=Roseixanthobacter finlandensis TaxID=3119922 RepID=UPI00372CD953
MARVVPIGGWPPRQQRTTAATRTRKPPRERGRKLDALHLAFIRQLPCLITGAVGDVEAAHVRLSMSAWGKDNAGTSARPSDMWTVPLSHSAHRDQHDMGELKFWTDAGINPLQICQQLYGVSTALRMSKEPPDAIVRHMTNIIKRARAEAIELGREDHR